MVFDLNQPPLPSPRGVVIDDDDDDDVVVIDPPPTLPHRKRKSGSFVVAGGAASSSHQVRDVVKVVDKESEKVSVVCSSCKGISVVKFLGTEEERRVWKCFKCLLKHGGDERPERIGGASGSLDLLDINSSPPREGEADGAYTGPDADVYRRVGDGTQSGKAPVPFFSSSHGQPVGLSSIFVSLPIPENRYILQKVPESYLDMGNSDSDGTLDHHEPVTVSLNEINQDLGAVTDKHCSTRESCLQTPKNVYLQVLRDYIKERKGVLCDGWNVEFEFCNSRIKTFAVYISPDGKRLESMPDVACHLGLPSAIQPVQSENTSNGLFSPQNGNQRRKEVPGVKPGNSRQRVNNPRGGVQSFGVDSADSASVLQADFPIQFEDFYLISVGAIDLRPTYHDCNQIWPVGYRSIWHDKITRSLFVFDITDGGDSGPNFTVRRYPCSKHTIPIGSTIISRKKMVTLSGEKNKKVGGCDDDDDSMSLQIILTENNAPCLDDVILSNGNGAVNPVKSSPIISRHIDNIGEFEVQGRSIFVVWENCCKTILDACHEAYKWKGAIRFDCEHDFGIYVEEEVDYRDVLSKFSCSTGPIDTLHVVTGDDKFRSAYEQVRKWLQADRSGLDAEFVQEIIEQLPGVTGCSQYTPQINRNSCTTLQTVRSGVLSAKRKRDDSDSDCYHGTSKRRIRENSQHSKLRGPFPLGKPISSKLPAFLFGDALQVWDFHWRFFEVLELGKPYSLKNLEDELISPWRDGRNTLEKSGSEIHNSEYIEAIYSNSSGCNCTGMVVSKFHISMLEVLVGELLSKVAMHVDPNFDAGESKSRRGKKKDSEYSAMIKKLKLGMMPVNEVTWPELARRYILAVFSMECNLESAEIAYLESGRVFHCLQGDGGTLCGSLT